MAAKSLHIYLAVLAGLWALGLGMVTFRDLVLHQSYPHNTLLFIREVQFTDFTIFDPRFAIWDHSAAFFDLPGFPFTYPAPLLIGFLAFWKLTPNPLGFYLATVAVFAMGAAVWIGVRFPLLRVPIGVTLVGAYPLFFLLDRANIEGLVWIAAALGIAAFVSNRFRTAAILLGLAVSMKIFPGALLLLFLARKRTRDFVWSLIFAAAFTAGSLALAGPTVPRALRGILHGMNFFRHTQILEYRRTEVGFEHSLLSCFKQVVHLFARGPRTNAAVELLYLPYLLAAAASFCVLYWFAIRKLPVLNQLLALTALSVTLPFISFDYTLVHIYIPFTVFLIFLCQDVAAGAARPSLAQILSILLPCAVLFAPLSWMLAGDVGFGAQVKAAALVCLIAASVKTPFPSSIFGELKTQNRPLHQILQLQIRGSFASERVS